MMCSNDGYTTPKHSGFSIIELMVAMVLSLILLAGVLSVFAGSRSTYETIDRWSRIQENGRFALDQVVRDIRSAGYLGCARGVKYKTTTLNNSTTLPWDFSTTLTAFQATGTSWSPAMDATVIQPATGNDVLVLRVPVREAVAAPLQSAMTSSTSGAISMAHMASSPFPLDGSSSSIALITNCTAQAVFQVGTYASSAGGDTITYSGGGATTTSPGNVATPDLGYVFPANSEVVPIQTIIYYVRQSTGAGTVCDATNQCSLWRRIGTNTPEELIEGVDAMQLLFGVDTDGDGDVDTYSNAQTVTTNTQWDSVLSVRIALLERSLDEYGSDKDTKVYTLLDTTAGPYNDRRIRQVFTSTIALRNRAP